MMKRVDADVIIRMKRALAAARFAWLAHQVKRSATFDRHWYLATYADAQGWDPIVHYLAVGAPKGYRPHALFDPGWWVEQQARQRHPNALIDYLRSPERWERSPSPYLIVIKGSQADETSPLASPLGLYHVTGGQGGLAPSPLFDRKFYIENNPDVAKAGFDSLLHYAANGGQEGRSPCVSFDAFWYLTVNPDVKARREEPLRHFLMRGARQGRAPHRAIDMPTLSTGLANVDPTQALASYQLQGRHSLTARTHPRLPPPGAAAPLLDDWPWQNGTIATASPRLLLLTAADGYPAFLEELERVEAASLGYNMWLVALDAAAAGALRTRTEPWLDLSDSAPEALPALLRAAFMAGPNLAIGVVAPPAHGAHQSAGEGGLKVASDVQRYSPIGKVSRKGPSAMPRTPADISVVVPSYNHADYLEARLASILAQRRRPRDIIIIDDASQDNSLALAKIFASSAPLPVRVVAREQNSGSPFSAWAEGAQLAQGELLWIAESDDLAHPRLLERLAPFLECDPGTVLAYCQSTVIGPQGQRLADDHLFYTDEIDPRRWEDPYCVPGDVEIAEALAIKNTIPNVSAALFRRQALADIVSRILPDRYCGDWRAYALLAERGRIGFSPEPLNLTRRHDRNATLEGERGLLAIREAQEIRLALWRRAETSAATIRAGYAQHLREMHSRGVSCELAIADFEGLARTRTG